MHELVGGRGELYRCNVCEARTFMFRGLERRVGSQSGGLVELSNATVVRLNP